MSERVFLYYNNQTFKTQACSTSIEYCQAYATFDLEKLQAIIFEQIGALSNGKIDLYIYSLLDGSLVNSSSFTTLNLFTPIDDQNYLIGSTLSSNLKLQVWNAISQEYVWTATFAKSSIITQFIGLAPVNFKVDVLSGSVEG